MFIAACGCPKGILGLGGEQIKNKLKDTSFILEMKSTYILNIVALLLS